MTTSLEAAFDLFSKWKQDSLKVRVDLTAGKPGLPDNVRALPDARSRRGVNVGR